MMNVKLVGCKCPPNKSAVANYYLNAEAERGMVPTDEE